MKQLAAIVAGLLFLVAGLAYVMHPSAPQEKPVVVEEDRPVSGALVGPEATNPYQCFNGVCTFYNRLKFNIATNTVCAVQAPKAGSSTLAFGSAQFVTSSTTPTFVEFSKSTTPGSTTTVLFGTSAIAANGKASLVATTTPVGASGIFAPGEWFVVGMRGNAGTYSPTGACQADFNLL